ncbi:MAG: ankyrin repeat domain-containing protein [Planctomycetota bacterium]
MMIGYSKAAGATAMTVYDAGKLSINFCSCGYEFDPSFDFDIDEFEKTQFSCPDLPDDWWRQFKGEDDVVRALADHVGMISLPYTAGYGYESSMTLYVGDDEQDAQRLIERVDLFVYGRKGQTATRPVEATGKLVRAIDAGDAQGVTEAIAEGADLENLPGVDCNALGHAINRYRWAKTDRERYLDVVDALIEAGIDPNGPTGWKKQPPWIDAFGGMPWQSHFSIPLMQRLVKHDVDLNVISKDIFGPGWTPLHSAAAHGKQELIKFLLAHGASLEARDAEGKTPREAALRSVQNTLDQLGDPDDGDDGDDDPFMKKLAAKSRETMKQYQDAADLLARAEAGEDVTVGWQDEAAADHARAKRIERVAERKMKSFEKKMSELGRLMNESIREARDDAVRALPDEIRLTLVKGQRLWEDAKRLQTRGFTSIGAFDIDEMPLIRLIALHSDELNAYAVIYRQRDTDPNDKSVTKWADFVRFREDGGTVTMTNAAIDEEAEASLDRFEKHRYRRLGLGVLYDKFVDFVKNDRPAATISPDEFRQRFEQTFAAETAARKATL